MAISVKKILNKFHCFLNGVRLYRFLNEIKLIPSLKYFIILNNIKEHFDNSKGEIIMKQKIAIFSDIHGNMTALEAVYKDMQEQKVTTSWFMGDLFIPGSGAQDLWDLMQRINPSVYVKGNWDELLIKGIKGRLIPDRPSKVYMCRLAEDLATKLDPIIIQQIKKWPERAVVKINDIKIALTHNLPDKDYGQDLYPTVPTKNFDKLFIEKDLDVAIYAHVHHPLMRYSSEEQLVLNPGSVGELFFKHPKFQKDLRAEYLILTIDEQGIREIDFRKVAYDREKEVKRAQKAQIPYLCLYEKQLKTGESHTHDYDLLVKLNKEKGYLEEVKKYNANHTVIFKKTNY